MPGRSAACLFLLLWAGCPSREYVCPDPIGKILLDDCETYRVRYESLKAELGASFAGLEGKISLGQTSLRDPSELLQVLSHRTLALCKDFNACRVEPLEYRQRREQSDRVFTAVTAIQTQLKGETDAENKAKLVRELIRVLGEDRPASPSMRRTRPDEPAKYERRSEARRDFHPSVPWFGARLLPPQPPAPPAGFPRLVAARFDLQHTQLPRTDYTKCGTSGFRPNATLWLQGQVGADDVLSVSFGERAVDCPVGRREENELLATRCDSGKKAFFTGTSFPFKLVYRRGVDGRTAVLDQRTVAVLFSKEGPSYQCPARWGIDLDELVREPLLVFEPYDSMLPAELDQPVIHLTFKLRRSFESTMRCRVNGKPAVGPLKGRDGFHGHFQDRAEGPWVEWRSARFRLPFVVRRERLDLPPETRPWPLAGSWRCVVSVEGEPVRELAFQVEPDGKLKPHPRQTERPRSGWLLEMKVIANAFEEPGR